MQYLIYLTNGKEESCVLISGNKDNAKERLESIKDIAKREEAWYELREYENSTTEKYTVISQ